MAIRLILALVVTLFTTLAGRALGSGQSRSADEIRLLMDDLQMLRLLTLERLLPIRAALLEMKLPCLRMTGEEMTADGTLLPAAAWARVAQRERAPGGKMEDLTEEDAGEVAALFEALHRLSRREQENQYARTIARLGRREESIRASGREKAKLYTSLGALTGLMVSVMLV